MFSSTKELAFPPFPCGLKRQEIDLQTWLFVIPACLLGIDCWTAIRHAVFPDVL